MIQRLATLLFLIMLFGCASAPRTPASSSGKQFRKYEFSFTGQFRDAVFSQDAEFGGTFELAAFETDGSFPIRKLKYEIRLLPNQAYSGDFVLKSSSPGTGTFNKTEGSFAFESGPVIFVPDEAQRTIFSEHVGLRIQFDLYPSCKGDGLLNCALGNSGLSRVTVLDGTVQRKLRILGGEMVIRAAR
ncbi:MAG: hypothetical protein A2428_13995 [Bdellovibrionales bacterium RIFOXYC1_FULL_54_43]|nr:MAG: hypothetical protein A2428_13995 [Bdellovibrionales bacterium RIFOXYC1_FULL_54_43]OFZ85626.1 MAG: hypothetical protein A2603_01430 [Bdellovibrionales bacterium RIFOXYD1_FULL_55_31]